MLSTRLCGAEQQHTFLIEGYISTFARNSFIAAQYLCLPICLFCELACETRWEERWLRRQQRLHSEPSSTDVNMFTYSSCSRPASQGLDCTATGGIAIIPQTNPRRNYHSLLRLMDANNWIRVKPYGSIMCFYSIASYTKKMSRIGLSRFERSNIQ